MPRPEKEIIVEELAQYFNEASGMYFADYSGLNVPAITELRSRLRKANVEFKVVKNTLTALAVQKADIQGVSPYIIGPTALAFSREDAILPAKILLEFAKEYNKRPYIKCGLVDGQVFDAEQVIQLSKLPGKEQLLAQVFAGLKSPITGFVCALSGILSKFVRTVDAIREAREEATE